MSDITVDVRLASDAWKTLADPEALARSAFHAAARELDEEPSGEIAILLTDDGEMHRLNAQWRGKEKPTDILSFRAEGPGPGFLGDLALGYGICARDAADLGLALEAHVTHLFIHGLLHLLGYDHVTDDSATVMEALEVSALARLGLPDPYSRKA
ncbi:MAG: rRNA maturation RNase YbeY [Pseudomonadota bacterium]